MAPRRESPQQRLLLTRNEAAASLGVSLRHFERHMQPHIPCLYSGQLRLYRPRDIEKWVDATVTIRRDQV